MISGSKGQKSDVPMTQNVWEMKAAKDLMQSEEWEAVKMSILSIGLERGEKIGLEKGLNRGRRLDWKKEWLEV